MPFLETTNANNHLKITKVIKNTIYHGLRKPFLSKKNFFLFFYTKNTISPLYSENNIS